MSIEKFNEMEAEHSHLMRKINEIIDWINEHEESTNKIKKKMKIKNDY